MSDGFVQGFFQPVMWLREKKIKIFTQTMLKVNTYCRAPDKNELIKKIESRQFMEK